MIRASLARGMTMDPVSEILREIRLSGTVYFKARFAAPWGMTIPSGDVANFHIVTSGSAKIRHEGRIVDLCQGDVILFPTGMGHDLLSDEEAHPRPGRDVIADIHAGAMGSAEPNDSGSTKSAGIICGHFALDLQTTTPFLHHLPEMILLRDEDGAYQQLVMLAEQLLDLQPESGDPGSGAVVDKLAEALLIETLRRFFLSNGLASELRPEQILGALLDPFVSKGLALMHKRTSDPWTVETLGRAVGLSRAAFAKRFTDLCGEPPLSYLTTLRLNRAWLLLRRSHITVQEASELVGYTNQSAFARAFKRQFGYAPGIASSVELH